jgi:hypothetical protein
MCRNFLICCSPICPFLLLFPGQLVSQWENNYQCLYPPDVSLFSCSSCSFSSYIQIFDPLGVDFCTGWEIGIYFQSSVCRLLVFPAPFVEEDDFSSSVCLWLLCQRGDGCSCVVLFLGLLFCFFSLCVSLCYFCYYGSAV